MAQIFPKWANKVPVLIPLVALVGIVGVVCLFWFVFTPYNLDVGYQPKQPVPFSHKKHVGQLGMDCRYCHTMVDRSPHAGVPPTETCMNCHANIKKDSLKLRKVIESFETDKPIEWLRIHKSPDYVYFDHRAHIKVGVSCKSCHGRIDQMQVVRQEKPLSMGWCFNCHRDPAPHLVPVSKVTDMEFVPSDAWILKANMKAKSLKAPVESCSGCHR